jgi:hypothetical protein
MKSTYLKTTFIITIIIVSWFVFIRYQLYHLHEKHLNDQQKISFQSKPKIINIVPPKILIKNFQPKFTSEPIKNVTIYLSPASLIFGKIVMTGLEFNQNEFYISSTPSYKDILKILPDQINISGKNINIKTPLLNLNNIYFNLPKLSINKSVTFNIYGDFIFNEQKINFNISALVNFQKEQLIAKNVHINLTTTINKQTKSLTVDTTIIYNDLINSLKISDINCNFLNINTKGNLQLINNLLSGKLHTEKFNLHETFANLNKNLTIKDSALEKISIDTTIENNNFSIKTLIDNFILNINTHNKDIQIFTQQPIKIADYANILTDKEILSSLFNKESLKLTINSDQITFNDEIIADFISNIELSQQQLKLTSNNKLNNIQYEAISTPNKFSSKSFIQSHNISAWLNYLFEINASFQATGTIQYLSNKKCLKCPTINTATIKANKIFFNNYKKEFNNLTATITNEEKLTKIKASAHANNKLYETYGTINKDKISAISDVYIKHPIINKKTNSFEMSGTVQNTKIKIKLDNQHMSNFSATITNILFKHFK